MLLPKSALKLEQKLHILISQNEHQVEPVEVSSANSVSTKKNYTNNYTFF